MTTRWIALRLSSLASPCKILTKTRLFERCGESYAVIWPATEMLIRKSFYSVRLK
jgi:hypothetical protein